MLAKDEDNDVRRTVAKNTNTNPELLSKLAVDKDVWVRATVAVNINTPIEALFILAKDIDVKVSKRAEKSLKERKEKGRNNIER